MEERKKERMKGPHHPENIHRFKIYDLSVGSWYVHAPLNEIENPVLERYAIMDSVATK